MTRVFVTIFILSMVYAMLCSGQAPLSCPVNSQPRQCGRLCEPTCEAPQLRFCKPADPSACKIECRCTRTYVRNTKTDLCVKLDQCPGRNQVEDRFMRKFS